MAFVVYLADSTVVNYGAGYSYTFGPSGVLAVSAAGVTRFYAPGYWTQVDEYSADEPPGRHANEPQP
ncbi:hypothetical protein NONO_c67020 [Nocardia nova SH22a]|uniref:Uncharacterized protein n=1 Tax=Nocardia nova SH22a TaxID=1415166 RepID=W5TQS3_9NOCA|nr:hypothetical protein [Nocardia nova]AHH21469.1 hypothetical protein NONO_c67020 [Nocardia nova SH22a]